MKLFRTLTLLVATLSLFGCTQPATHSSKSMVTAPTPKPQLVEPVMQLQPELPDPLPDLSKEPEPVKPNFYKDEPAEKQMQPRQPAHPEPEIINLDLVIWDFVPAQPIDPDEDPQFYWAFGWHGNGEITTDVLVVPMPKA